MNFPKWLKTTWWIVLIVIISIFLYNRLDSLTQGSSSNFDLLVFAIWIGLLLMPLFQEIELFGVKLKKEVEDVKQSVHELKNDLLNAINIQSNISPHFHMSPSPPIDSSLPDIEKQFKEYLKDFMQSYDIKNGVNGVENVDEKVLILFQTRYNLEKELRRIMESRRVFEDIRAHNLRISVIGIIKELKVQEVIDDKLAHIIREVYAVCSPAIHGEEVTTNQVKFVKDVAPDLITTLKKIH